MASMVEKRLPVTTIKSLVRGGLSDAEVYQLIVPRRTLAHRIARHQPLSKGESDKAVRVARISAMAEHVFGEPERAWRWLRKPQQRFDGKAPSTCWPPKPAPAWWKRCSSRSIKGSSRDSVARQQPFHAGWKRRFERGRPMAYGRTADRILRA